MAHVAHVDREFLGVLGDADLVGGHDPAALFAVEREHHDAVAHGQHQRGLRTIDAVAGGHLLAAGLQEIAFGDRLDHVRLVVGLLQHREDGADRDVDVDVAAAVERVEHQQVFALRITVGHHMDGFHFLGGHRR